MASADVGLVIVAAGSGTRLGAEVPKAFVPLAGVPILGHALRGARSCPGLAEVVVVGPSRWLGQAEEVCRSAGFASDDESVSDAVSVTVVAGGATRGDSVAAGLAALSDAVRVVLVHDAARCLTPPAVFARVVKAVRAGAGAAVPGVPVVDTIKQVDAAGLVVGTPDRAVLRAIQTPQGFARAVLERAHAGSPDATDDAGLVERLGEPVLVVAGDERALKVTTCDDLDRAARFLTAGAAGA
ncbi:MAG: 2-C-methyl-D-erythritol 4-phosphate cytidylyltransferase [Intrasporangium sp.]|uniref:2-C-methyl-D-erythritol 4-phosphate cytidylyltransferase n=1 Tax=Intrasporangium sp. TaxID=1925024 RepID=UPI002648DB7D|nr:2-C-methyl-D-erythritol 4-phosphate cytidylyltransferase [Intrasporangium sp.]MDN5797310.1 2-C-methyl-D-erythritol 4-phosphate cytidylyltransferase [Intrasporangium sp.]